MNQRYWCLGKSRNDLPESFSIVFVIFQRLHYQKLIPSLTSTSNCPYCFFYIDVKSAVRLTNSACRFPFIVVKKRTTNKTPLREFSMDYCKPVQKWPHSTKKRSRTFLIRAIRRTNYRQIGQLFQININPTDGKEVSCNTRTQLRSFALTLPLKCFNIVDFSGPKHVK